MKITIIEYFKSLFNQELKSVINNPISIGSIPNPSEELQILAVRLDEHAIDMIDSPCEKALQQVLLKNPYHIKFIENPSEELQILAITIKANSISLIEKPCLKAKFACILDRPENITLIQNPEKEIQIAVVQDSPELISRLDNPCEAAQLTAVLNSPETIFTINNPNIRTCLVAIEKLAKVKIFPSDKNLEIISGIINQCHKLKEVGLDYKEMFKNEVLKLTLNETL